MGKGRRKKGDSVTSNADAYYGEKQEDAVLRYLSSTDSKEKDKIFTNELRKPLHKMIESIIRRYKLYAKDCSFEDLHADTFSFLVTKMDKFRPEENKKSYSYFGTIIKHYLLGRILKEDKEMKQNVSYEDLYSYIEGDSRYSYSIEKPEGSYDDFIAELHTKIEYKIENESLNDNEKKVAYAIIDILKNWELIFKSDVNSSDKFNKNQILSYIRTYTLLNTKDIRVSMKKFKELYSASKLFRIDEGLL